ncbi:MAG TPA: putative metallopeptidase [Patescibacteria group bacterium]|nr:putative metallopeptidase [Patescibacteria group bacterium]
MDWEKASDVKKDVAEIVSVLKLGHIQKDRLFIYRTRGSKARAYARTWGFPKIFQDALQVRPAYVIEVLAKYYDHLSSDEKKKILIHELLHIPKNFSGALLPHRTRHRKMHSVVNQLFKEYKKKTNDLSF